MSYNYIIITNTISFERNEKKNKVNISKHKVSFEEAQSVFYDDNAIDFYDIEHSYSEERFILFGISYKLNLLIVCYCSRKSPTVIRIISARKATKMKVYIIQEKLYEKRIRFISI
jgi:uncharacterized protein